jgi:hypothetical protein
MKFFSLLSLTAAQRSLDVEQDSACSPFAKEVNPSMGDTVANYEPFLSPWIPGGSGEVNFNFLNEMIRSIMCKSIRDASKLGCPQSKQISSK